MLVVRWLVRDGRPLPGRTLAAVVSQLAHRVFGPLRADRARAMLAFYGLAGQPAGRQVDIAARHGVSARTVANWAAAVTAAGTRLPLPAALITEATRPTRPGEDHLARTRIAAALGLPTPRPPASPSVPAEPSQANRAAATVAARVLATVGPLPLVELHAAVERSRRHRSLPPPTPCDLAIALTALGATIDDQNQWHAPHDVAAPARYRALGMHAAGRTLTRSQMINALQDAGYARTSASSRKISTHLTWPPATGPRVVRVLPPVGRAGRLGIDGYEEAAYAGAGRAEARAGRSDARRGQRGR